MRGDPVVLSSAGKVCRIAAVCLALLVAPMTVAPSAQAGAAPSPLAEAPAEGTRQVDAYPWLCRSNMAIRSLANGMFVSADLARDSNESGMLRASWAGTIGPWELFTVCFESTWWAGIMSIYSQANGRYVSAEIGYGGPSYAMLRARHGGVGPWERFILHNNFNTFSIQSEANGQFVAAEIGWSGRSHGMLRARNSFIGPWEKFEFVG